MDDTLLIYKIIVGAIRDIFSSVQIKKMYTTGTGEAVAHRFQILEKQLEYLLHIQFLLQS